MSEELRKALGRIETLATAKGVWADQQHRDEIAEIARQALAPQPAAPGGIVRKVADYLYEGRMIDPPASSMQAAKNIVEMVIAHLSGAGGGSGPWLSLYDAPLDGSIVETFGSLHFDSIGESPRVQRSWFDQRTESWVSREWGSHEPHFWRPLPPPPQEGRE